MKHCNGCNSKKPLSEFPDKWLVCKSCKSLHSAKQYHKKTHHHMSSYKEIKELADEAYEEQMAVYRRRARG